MFSILGQRGKNRLRPPPRKPKRKVFIVHGHDNTNASLLYSLIQEWGLTPIMLIHEPNQGRILLNKFEDEANRADFVFVIFTPDDLVIKYSKPESGIKRKKKQYYQARPNVIHEFGWFQAKLSRDKICVIRKRGTEVYSDIYGITSYNFNRSIMEIENKLKRELKVANLL